MLNIAVTLNIYNTYIAFSEFLACNKRQTSNMINSRKVIALNKKFFIEINE